MTALHPFVPFLVGALLVALSRGSLRSFIALATPLIGGWLLWQVPDGTQWQLELMDMQLTPFRADALSLLFGAIFHIAAFIAVLYALHVKDSVQQVSALLYAGSGIGAVFAGDLLSLFVFWELLALSSVFLIWARRTESALRAGQRYLIMQVLSGLILLGGALLLYRETGNLAFDAIGLEGLSGWLIFLAFGIKAGFPLLHTWITDAYPEATPTGTVFLSIFTTKVAIYALARGYAGTDLLIYVGLAMTLFPIFFAVVENDMRRVLSYSMINQLGFMVCGIGIGTALALNGAVSHLVAHILYKSLLFMSMGSVLHMTGQIRASELGGLYKTMPKTTLLCIIGAASISAFPLFSGFVSKAMIMSASLQAGHQWVWIGLLFAAAGVLHHAGIKIPYFAFFAHDSGIRTSEPPWNMLAAMALAALMCIGIGVYPWGLYALLPYDSNYNPYDAGHVLAQLQLLLFAALAFVWMHVKRIEPPEIRSVHLDVDWFYRRLLPGLLRPLFTGVWATDRHLRSLFMRGLNASLTFIARHEPDGVLSKNLLSSSMVIWATLLLASYLVLSFL